MTLPRLIASLLILLAALVAPAGAGPTLTVPSGIDPGPWEVLLRRYVDDRGLVAYGAWKADEADVRALDAFLAQYAPVPTTPATGTEEIAALINAYNAFTVRLILQHYPVESIRTIDSPFGGDRWTVGGRMVSVDEIEHRNLRPLYGWKVHATIVCAARSCPPLLREAYRAENLERLTEEAYRTWLGRDDLSELDPGDGNVGVSAIFKWFKSDFAGDGELAVLLGRFGPEAHRRALAAGKYRVEFLPYHWGLNDQGGRGADFRASWLDRMFGNAR
jgi:hypothetical protein